MDWVTALITILGGLDIIAIIQLIRYRKENKALKTNEVKVSNVDAQKQEIDLADMYKDKVLEMLDQVSQKQDKGNDNQDRMLAKLEDMDDRITNIETYLDGEFDRWKEEHGKGEQ